MVHENHKTCPNSSIEGIKTSFEVIKSALEEINFVTVTNQIFGWLIDKLPGIKINGTFIRELCPRGNNHDLIAH